MTPDEQKNLDNRLFRAAQRGKTKAVQKLLAAGANLHANQEAALDLAACFGQTKMVKMLLTLGANVHASDDGALHAAVESGHTVTADVLRNAIMQDAQREQERAELERQRNPLLTGTGLTFAESRPEDIEALLREAIEEQVRYPTRPRAPPIIAAAHDQHS
jgi:hypothetical protein